MKINAHRLALVLGLLMAGWHALWALFVVVGAAQALIDFIFWAHFISPPFHVVAFDPLRALVLVSATGVLGYAAGLLAGVIWNAIHHD